jgi:hypothetical protein
MGTTLTDRLLSFIEKLKGTEVSYETIKDKATAAGYTVNDLHTSLSDIHKVTGIKTRQDATTIYYRYELPKQRVYKPGERYHPTPELDAIMDAEVRAFWEHSSLVTEVERQCYYASMTDKNRYKTCECSACTQWRWMLMDRNERAMAETIRQASVLKMV